MLISGQPVGLGKRRLDEKRLPGARLSDRSPGCGAGGGDRVRSFRPVQLGGGCGFGLHITIGYFVIPLAALLLLIISFFAKIPGGIRWALILFLTVVVQTLLAGFAHEVAEIGWLHGMVALVLFGLAVTAGIRAGRQAPVAVEAADTSVA